MAFYALPMAAKSACAASAEILRSRLAQQQRVCPMNAACRDS